MGKVPSSRLCVAVVLVWLENRCKKADAQIFLAFLLAPFMANWIRFCLVAMMDFLLEMSYWQCDVGRRRKWIIYLPYTGSSSLCSII